jgi:hypothetical protein
MATAWLSPVATCTSRAAKAMVLHQWEALAGWLRLPPTLTNITRDTHECRNFLAQHGRPHAQADMAAVYVYRTRVTKRMTSTSMPGWGQLHYRDTKPDRPSLVPRPFEGGLVHTVCACANFSVKVSVH